MDSRLDKVFKTSEAFGAGQGTLKKRERTEIEIVWLLSSHLKGYCVAM